MKKISSFISTFILSYLFWILFLIQDFNIFRLGVQELLVGVVVAIIISYFTCSYFAPEDGFWIFKKFRIINFLIFVPVYLWELIKANWSVAVKSLSKNIKVEPAIVKIETDLKSDYGIAMLSNCITLTPGTITMDVLEENNKSYMYIHWIDGETEDTKEAAKIIKGKFEHYVRRIFK
mgnify:CR=1 FL=1